MRKLLKAETETETKVETETKEACYISQRSFNHDGLRYVRDRKLYFHLSGPATSRQNIREINITWYNLYT